MQLNLLDKLYAQEISNTIERIKTKLDKNTQPVKDKPIKKVPLIKNVLR